MQQCESAAQEEEEGGRRRRKEEEGRRRKQSRRERQQEDAGRGPFSPGDENLFAKLTASGLLLWPLPRGVNDTSKVIYCCLAQARPERRRRRRKRKKRVGVCVCVGGGGGGGRTKETDDFCTCARPCALNGRRETKSYDSLDGHLKAREMNPLAAWMDI